MRNLLNSAFWWAVDLAERTDQQMRTPNWLRVLLVFWIAIGCAGLFLMGTTIIKFDWMVFIIGFADLALSVGFGLYYYSQFIEATGRHQKSDKK